MRNAFKPTTAEPTKRKHGTYTRIQTNRCHWCGVGGVPPDRQYHDECLKLKLKCRARPGGYQDSKNFN